MEFNEIIESLKSFEGTEDYKNYVSGFVNADSVSAFLKTDEGKELLAPINDSHFNKSLKTWKENNLEKEVNAEIKKRFPEADPKDTEIARLAAEIEAMKAESARKDLTNKALTKATEKGLPIDLISYFVGEDEEATTKNIEKLESVFNSAVEKVVTERLGNTHKPDAEDDEKVLDAVALGNMTPDQINEYFKKNLKK